MVWFAASSSASQRPTGFPRDVLGSARLFQALPVPVFCKIRLLDELEEATKGLALDFLLLLLLLGPPICKTHS